MIKWEIIPSETEREDIEQLFAPDSDVDVEYFEYVDKKLRIYLFQHQPSAIVHQLQCFVYVGTHISSEMHVLYHFGLFWCEPDFLFLTFDNLVHLLLGFLCQLNELIGHRTQQFAWHVVN